MTKPLVPHPVAMLFPELSAADYAALKEDIRLHGVKVPILVHGGQILDGRHRYRACRELGVRCLVVEWNGYDPWLEVQSRNLVRRHLAKDQVYAIRKLAAQQFPELAKAIEAERENAKARKAQAKGQPRGQKALLRSQDLHRESADRIGAQIGVSGTTVKRVDRLAREAPELLPRVAAGELSVKHALREVSRKNEKDARARFTPAAQAESEAEAVDRALHRIEQLIRAEWSKCPSGQRAKFLHTLQRQVQKLMPEQRAASGSHRNNIRMVGSPKPSEAMRASH
jgi:ParB-like chromosome segregation protein Spo0J